MKKTMIWLVLLAMLTACLMPALGEELPLPQEEPSPLGDWYADVEGITLQLTLKEDGAYAITVFGQTDDSGTWTAEDGFVYLDGNEDAPLSFDGDALTRVSDALIFTRTPIEGYVPAPVLEEISPFAVEGHWVPGYIDLDGVIVPADALGEDTELWIECEMPTVDQSGETPVILYGDALAAMGGQLFGDTVQRFVFDGAAYTLALTEANATVTLQIQEDGLLRLTLRADEEQLTLYLYFAGPVVPEEAE